MYESFITSIHNYNYQISKGHYMTFSKLYKDLKALELEVDFAYRHSCLTYEEFNNIENEITNTLLLFRNWQLESVSD